MNLPPITPDCDDLKADILEITLPHNWRPRPHQQRLWTFLARGGKRAVEIAHRRWGKDDVALHRAATEAHKRVGTYWHMLPEYAQARKAIWNAVNPHTGRRRIDEAFPREIRDSTNDQEMFIRFKHGSTWQVVGSDSYDRLVGTPPVGIVFSEWALANPAAWAYLAPILVENNGWALFITTPRGRNHAKLLLDMARSDPAWFAEVQTIADTGAISLQQVEQQRREYHALFGADAGDALIEQEYWCSFTATVLGAYWGRELEAAEREGRITRLDVDHGHPVHTAWDIGIDDPMAIWCFQVGPGVLNIVDYYESNGHGFDHYCAWLGERGYHGTDWVPHDARLREVGAPGGRTRIETMVSLGRKPLLVPDHKLMDGINAARRTLPVARFDAVRCVKGLDALREYRAAWDSGARTFKQAPLHNWASHGADAWRHLSVAWRYPTPPADPGAPSTSGNDALTVDALLASAGLRKTRV